ncbi:MAG: response regulator [Lachnospiraceae bacterium]|nr:response regulator [Lachnospiraceae bacterium]
MTECKMIVIGERESFIVRVLVQKSASAGADCKFVPADINSINANLEGVSLITLFMDNNERPKENVLHFLSEKMEELAIQMIVTGEQLDVQYVVDRIPESLIYAKFIRPVDNEKYAEKVSEFFAKVQSGDFKKSILIVDDDPQYLGLVREWLKGSYKVAMASSGLQAIKWLGKNKVDLILLDHEMPVTSGPQVLEMLRSDEDTKSIPVMFLTGKGDKDSVMAVVSLQPEGYFLKTIGKDELLEKLADFFVSHRKQF